MGRLPRGEGPRRGERSPHAPADASLLSRSDGADAPSLGADGTQRNWCQVALDGCELGLVHTRQEEEEDCYTRYVSGYGCISTERLQF
ncbi:hypothetical protein MATL_G00156510 [Megalops atlanticus]|uniref:Uncharacterized protein n=1 Tax=Megalops atlanticus TaxID=7932 RepID=A0A9D3PQN7_MEGAT|nr:hypothetical protein MATL_G00156510 [Megalops atlanticus]